MKVIIINGSGGCGKSTFVELCKQIDRNVFELSMVDFVKNIAKKIGWDGNKDERGRKFLADLKDCIERYDRDIIYNSIDDDIYYYRIVCEHVSEEPIFFINARSPKDINYLIKKYDAVSLLIRNPRVSQVTSNHADKDVYSYCYNYEIMNSGTLDDLKEKAKTFLEEIK